MLLKLVFRSIKVAPPLLYDYLISDLILKTDSKADRPKSKRIIITVILLTLPRELSGNLPQPWSMLYLPIRRSTKCLV